MKIPTLIGIALIVALIGSLGLWFYSRETPVEDKIEVLDLQTANISGDTATIVWQTNSPAIGEVLFAETENLSQTAPDNRDSKSPLSRITHFVTIKNIKPDTKYFYKIKNNNSITPEKALGFKTSNLKPSEDLDFSFLKPIKGTILNTNLNPIDESLIFLEIPGAQPLASFSSTAGNFILPLKLVLSKDETKIFNIPQDTQATISVKKGKLESRVKIVISDSTVNLPPIAIGNNLDLSNYVHAPITAISFGKESPVSLDFNSDGIINSLDLAILRGKAGTNSLLNIQERQKFDTNSDGIVDQKDVDNFSKTLVNI